METCGHNSISILLFLTFIMTTHSVLSHSPYRPYDMGPMPLPEPIVFPGEVEYRGNGQGPGGMGIRGRTWLSSGRGQDIPPAPRCPGACLHPTQCAKLGGNSRGFCPGHVVPASVCCQFEQSCSHVTTDALSHFQSPGYPRPTLGSLVCQFDILIQPGVCAVRLDFLEFNTTNPLDRGLCHVDQLLVMNSKEGTTFPRCGELSGYSTIVAMDPRHKVPLTLLSIIQSSKEQYKWNIGIKQIRCDLVRYFNDYPNCGKTFPHTESPESEKPALITSTSPSTSTSTPISTSTSTPVNTTIKNPMTPTSEPNPDSENVVEIIANDDQVYFSQPTLDSLDNLDQRQSVDTAFFIAYLKQAYEAISNSTNPNTNSNNTLCKNRGGDIHSEKLMQLRTHSTLEDDLGRIIRGDEALVNEFPWQVSIQDRSGHVCGGAILSPNVILTASHCFLSVAPVPLRNVRVVVGDLNFNSTTESKEEVVEMEGITFHSHFDPYYLENDIALISLKKPIVFRDAVQPICLPERDNSYTGQKAMISGWGATSYPHGHLATHLQRGSNRIIENSECKKKLKIDYLFSTMMCALAPNCSGTCFGDSGGPLVVKGEEGKNTLVGLVSFGIGGCALFPYWPDVYTRVSEFLDWISYAVHL